MTLSQGSKKVLAMVGYPLLALVVFAMTISYTFPYKRVKSLITDKVRRTHDMTIGDMGPTWFPGGVKMESVLIKSRPKNKDDKPSLVAFQSVKARVGFFSALFGKPKISFKATNSQGQITGHVVQAKDYLDLGVQAKDFPLNQLPGVREAVGIPVTGALNAEIELELPEKKWKKAEGLVKFDCQGCTVGDGVSKMKFRAPEGKKLSARAKSTLAFASEGITVPKLNLGETEGEIVIEKGVGEIKTFTSQSDDGFFRLGGKVKFEDPVNRSLVPGCITFKFSESLKERLKKKEGPEKNFAAIEFMIAPVAKKDDGSFAFPLQGTLGRLKINKKKKCNKAGDGVDPSSTPRKKTTSSPRPSVKETNKKKSNTNLDALNRTTSNNEKNDDKERLSGGAIKGISSPGIPPAIKDRAARASPSVPKAVLKRDNEDDEDEDDDDDEDEDDEDDESDDEDDDSEDESIDSVPIE